jgi:hypothetical protein
MTGPNHSQRHWQIMASQKTNPPFGKKVAEVPEDGFEADVANPVAIPTAASIVAAHEPRKAEPTTQAEEPADPRALSLWGHLKDSVSCSNGHQSGGVFDPSGRYQRHLVGLTDRVLALGRALHNGKPTRNRRPPG